MVSKYKTQDCTLFMLKRMLLDEKDSKDCQYWMR